MAAIEIKWNGLLQVAGVGLAFAVGGAVVFALGVLGLSRAATVRDGGHGGGHGGHGRATGLLVAGACFAICAALVGYGLYLLVPQFH